MYLPLGAIPAYGVSLCLCSTVQPSGPSWPTTTVAPGSQTTKSASFPGAIPPSSPRPATHAGLALKSLRGGARKTFESEKARAFL